MTAVPAQDFDSQVVLLGASNVSLGWPQLMRAVTRRCAGRVHVLTAHGMGRSYLGTSRFGLRTAPGILNCQLWNHLAADCCPLPTAALITDLGNDLVYGHTAGAVVQAAADVVERLRQMNPHCEIVVTRPPLASVESLSPLRFRLFRTVLFPMCGLSLSEIRTAARQLDEGLQELDGVTMMPQQTDWFGFDPIHIRRRYRESAFDGFLAAWPAEHTAVSSEDQLTINRPAMGFRWVLGQERTSRQPSVEAGRVSVSAW